MDEDPRFRGRSFSGARGFQHERRRRRCFKRDGGCCGGSRKGSRRVILPELRFGLHAHRQGRRAVDDLPARQGAGVVRNDGLRQVRAEARTGELRSTTAKDRGLADFAGAGFRSVCRCERSAQAAGRARRAHGTAGQGVRRLAHVVADAGGGGWPER